LDKLLIGSHVSISKPGYLLHALDEAIEADENCFMFYTGAPQNTIRQPLTSMNLEEFKIQIHKNNVDIDNVVVHAPYIINIASSDIEKKKFAISFLSSEIRRVSEIGCKLIVVHPGNATNGISVGEAIKNCADVVNEINKVNKNVVICLETMAGKGNEIGKTFEELNSIIQLIHNKSLIGVCIDTCHT
jgi:deoxyribonuclease-4